MITNLFTTLRTVQIYLHPFNNGFLLQLSNSVCSLIWTTTPGEAKHLVSLSEDQFVDAVNDAFVSQCFSNGPRQANLCLRAFRHDKF